MEEFITAVRARWPHVLVQFEDFQNSVAFTHLANWRDKICCFNDDIQGTAAVVLTGLYSAMRVKKEKLSDQRILFLGAGAAAAGIAHLIADAMVEDGITEDKALSQISFFDSKGLVTKTRGDKLAVHKLDFAHDWKNTTDFAEAIRQIKPAAIIGVSATGGAFTEEVVKAMTEINAQPIIMALSNPTSKSECTAKQAYEWSEGKCLFACGSPFGRQDLRAASGQQQLRLPGDRLRLHLRPCEDHSESGVPHGFKGFGRPRERRRSRQRQSVSPVVRSAFALGGNRGEGG